MKLARILITGGSGFIGTNLSEQLRRDPSLTIANLDLAAPKLGAHAAFWQAQDVRSGNELTAALNTFRPDAVVHLAARTDLHGRGIGDYSSNTDGTSRLLEALHEADFAGPAIFTSSMYVCRPGYQPVSDTDFQPHTIYGESKVIGEQVVRAANPSYPWVIIRPTSIWGPWFGTPYADFFNIVLSGRYLHISGNKTRKTYGYVGNTVAQILTILNNASILRGRTFYLGDWPAYDIGEWADEIASFVPYMVPRVPKTLFEGLALVGDTLQLVGVPFPMTSFRLRNLTTNNTHDLSPIQGLMENLPYTRVEGNRATVDWLKGNS